MVSKQPSDDGMAKPEKCSHLDDLPFFANESSVLVAKINNHENEVFEMKLNKVSRVLIVIAAFVATFAISHEIYHHRTFRFMHVGTMQNLVGFEVNQCMDIDKDLRGACCTDPSKPVLGGVDVVELYKQGEDTMPKIGDDNIGALLTTTAGEYLFNFISQENLDAFLADPWRYAPAWGGFCGYGVAFEEKSYKDDAVKRLGPYVDLSAWTISAGDGRLYFFGGGGPRGKFLADERAVQYGNDNWSGYYAGNLYDGHFDTNCFHRQTYQDLINNIKTPDEGGPKNGKRGADDETLAKLRGEAP
uniref:Uncharacterized protein n=1 Tax=Fibrocapsa japonica TaxID=94617 RepID=A0A7S2V077_9STRA|mmetsp:Transcript_22791/g.33070  ORF Transcript_22791/g.33070 Transcript_22791/m.33070 type:complete len:302 (+) Transcript_22791:44-949(+)